MEDALADAELVLELVVDVADLNVPNILVTA